METSLYWITRLDGLLVAFTIICVLSACVSVALCMRYIFLKFDNDCTNLRAGISLEYVIGWTKKYLKLALTVCFISSLTLIVCPTTKEMLLIKGVSAAYEYVQSSDTAKELPEKTLKALDKLLSDYIGEEDSQKKQEGNR